MLHFVSTQIIQALLLRRNVRSGDVLVNALGLLTFIDLPPNQRENIEFDNLADWLYEQQLNIDGTYSNAFVSGHIEYIKILFVGYLFCITSTVRISQT
jgi:hypothetical protein